MEAWSQWRTEKAAAGRALGPSSELAGGDGAGGGEGIGSGCILARSRTARDFGVWLLVMRCGRGCRHRRWKEDAVRKGGVTGARADGGCELGGLERTDGGGAATKRLGSAGQSSPKQSVVQLVRIDKVEGI